MWWLAIVMSIVMGSHPIWSPIWDYIVLCIGRFFWAIVVHMIWIYLQQMLSSVVMPPKVKSPSLIEASSKKVAIKVHIFTQNNHVTSYVLPISGVHFNGTKRQKRENMPSTTFVHSKLHSNMHERICFHSSYISYMIVQLHSKFENFWSKWIKVINKKEMACYAA